jgi:hypothetical protein
MRTQSLSFLPWHYVAAAVEYNISIHPMQFGNGSDYSLHALLPLALCCCKFSVPSSATHETTSPALLCTLPLIEKEEMYKQAAAHSHRNRSSSFEKLSRESWQETELSTLARFKKRKGTRTRKARKDSPSSFCEICLLPSAPGVSSLQPVQLHARMQQANDEAIWTGSTS